LLFEETPTLGFRIHHTDRYILPRSFHSIRLLGGTVRIKVAETGEGRTKASPEFRDCEALAKRTGHPVYEILELARQAFARATKAKSPGQSSKSPKKVR